ncbi:MAG: hypothetical protein LBM63_00960 [Rikenellaceae bacterium]|jgi:hypothetical protein|nr:hypothetical protein [Rikenellaceae bacterium]
MFKKISYILTVALALGFAACSDQNEVVENLYDEIAAKPVVKHVSYTLTEADYGTISKAAVVAAGSNKPDSLKAVAVKSTSSLNSFATSDNYVPAIVAKTFPILTEGSTVQVTSNYIEDLPAYLGTLAGATTYTLSAADYASVWGEGAGVEYLTPANSAKAKLPAILATARPEAASGDVVLVTYKYSDQEPSLAPSNTVDCVMTKDDYQLVVTAVLADPATSMYEGKFPDTEWYYGFNANYGNVSFRLTGSSSSSRDIEVSKNNDTELHALDGNTEAQAKLLWKRLVEKGMPLYAGLKWPDAEAGQIYNITVAVYYPDGVNNKTPNEYTLTYSVAEDGSFRYVSGADALYAAPTAMSALPTTPAVTRAAATRAIISAPVDQKAVYTFNGSAWAPYSGAMVLGAADYTAMGSKYGNLEPAQATAYLPQYLAGNVEYAKEGDKVAVVYVRYEGSAKTVADEYVYTDGKWIATNVPVVKSEQFVYSSIGWIFDPTVSFAMSKADYQMLVTSVLTNPATSMYTRGTYTNEEWYYGTSAYYDNINFRIAGSETSSREVPSSVANDTELHALDGKIDAQVALLWERLEQKGIPQFLAVKFPDAPLEVSGVDMVYKVGVAVYYPDGVTNTTINYVLSYKVVTAGTASAAPTFTFLGRE